MWKCIGLLLFFGQWIVVTAESSENPDARSASNSECCPCPETRSDDLTPSASTHIIDSCPCRSRSADSDSAASIFSPASSVVRPSSRQAQQKEVKHLLEPEVGLVSSVLETLREATEEEYEEALAKDAAKNAKQDEINNSVTIVVNPESRDVDAVPEASHSHAVRCIHPLEDQESVLRRNSLFYPHIGLPRVANRPILEESHDINEAASNYHRSLNTPRNVITSNNHRNHLHNILETPIYDQLPFVTPSDNLVRFVPEYENKYLPVTSLLPRRRNNLLASHNPFQIQNILKKEVPTALSKEIFDGGYVSREAPRNTHENVLDAVLAENKHTNNCIVDDYSNNNKESSEETKIWNILPNSDNHKIQSKSSEVSDYVEEPLEYIDEKQYNIDDSNQRGTFRDVDGVVEESGNNYDTQVSPSNNNNKFFVYSPYDSEFEKSSQQDKEISSIKDNTVKTIDDFSQANGVIHDKLKSSLDNVLQRNSVRETSANDCSNVNPSTLEPQARSDDNKNTMISMNNYKDLLSEFSEQKTLGLKELNNQNEDMLLALQEIKSKSNYDKNLESEINADEKNSENPDTCLVYGMEEKENAYSDQNEMKMAASDSSSTRFGFSQLPQSALKNSQKNIFSLQTPANALEDINLDIFQYQPTSLDKGNRRNTQASLPRLNMQSYKTKLPIPKSVALKPVKLQKAFRKGNDLLGAVLTIEPHADNINNNMKSSQGRNSHNILEPTLGMLPSFNELRSFLDNSANNLLKIPHLSRNYETKLASPFLNIEKSADNLRVYTEDALNNVQQSLNNILPNIHDRDRNTLGNSLLNPNGLVQSISKNDLKMNEKLHNINERLKSILDQSRASYIHPIHSMYKVRPKSIQTERKQTNVEQKLLNQNQFLSAHRPPSRLSSNRDSNILHRNLNPKGSVPTLKLSENSRIKLPIGKIDRQIVSENYWLGKTLNSRPDPQKKIQPTENNSAVSFITPKKSTNLESLINKKSILPTLEIKLGNPTGFRNLLTKNLKLSKEQKISPSEKIYKKLPVEDKARQNLPEENQDSKLVNLIGQRSDRPSQSLSKTLLLPNIAESRFLSKVKEAVNKDNLQNSNNENKNVILSSASANLMSTELPKDKITFDCKMVCNKP